MYPYEHLDYSSSREICIWKVLHSLTVLSHFFVGLYINVRSSRFVMCLMQKYNIVKIPNSIWVLPKFKTHLHKHISISQFRYYTVCIAATHRITCARAIDTRAALASNARSSSRPLYIHTYINMLYNYIYMHVCIRDMSLMPECRPRARDEKPQAPRRSRAISREIVVVCRDDARYVIIILLGNSCWTRIFVYRVSRNFK